MSPSLQDFQLLLSGGSADITLSRLKSVIRFNHAHGSSATVCDRFEKYAKLLTSSYTVESPCIIVITACIIMPPPTVRMFWRVVSHMTNSQRQQLLYFATGSAALPVSTDTTDRAPGMHY